MLQWLLNQIPDSIAAIMQDLSMIGFDTGVPGGPVSQYYVT